MGSPAHNRALAARRDQNHALRQQALREELQAREHIRQIGRFLEIPSDELGLPANPDNPRSPSRLEVESKKIEVRFRILNKVLPDLKAVTGEIAVHDANDQLNRAGALLGAAIGAIIEGEAGPGSDPGETPGKDESVVPPACDPPEEGR